MTAAGGTCYATTPGGSVAGQRAHIILCDDLIKDVASSKSLTQMDSIQEWFDSELSTRLHPNGKIMIIGSRRMPLDIFGRLIETNKQLNKEKQWRVVRMPALNNDGTSYWPNRFPAEELQRIKNTYEVNGASWIWNSLYQNDPKGDPSEIIWGLELFDDIFYNELPEGLQGVKVMAIDPNVGTGSKPGDYGVILCGIYDRNGTLWIENSYVQQGSYDKLEDRAVELIKEFNPQGCLIETNQAFRILADNIFRKCKENGVPFPPIVNRISTENKKSRIDITLSPLLIQKKIKLKDISGNKIGINQMKNFPLGHDDYPDCIFLLTQMLAELLNKSEVVEDIKWT